MPKRLFQVLEVTNPPGAGLTNKTRFELVPGWRYHLCELRIYSGAAVKPFDGVSSVRVLLSSGSGDNAQFELTPQEINEHNSLFNPDKYGATVEGGGNLDTPGETARLPLLFTDLERTQFIAQERTTFDLVNQSAFVEVAATALVTAGVNFECWVWAEPLAEVLPNIQAGRSAPLNVLGNGRPLVMLTESTVKTFNGNFVDVIDLARDREYFAIHFYNPAGANITEIIAKINGVEIWNAKKAGIDSILRRHDLHPVLTRTSIIPDMIGKTSDAWNLNGIDRDKFRIRVNFDASVSASMKIVSFRFGEPK